MLGLNETSMSNVIAVWICSNFRVQFRVSRYSSQKLWPFELPWSFRLSSRASWYIMGLHRHSIQNLWQFEFARRFVVQFLESRYVIVRNRTSESRHLAIWICPKLPCRISSVAVYVGSKSIIHVKSYSSLNMLHLSCPISSVSIFESKVMVVWNLQELSSFISSVSIYHGHQSETRVKSYCSLDLQVDSVFSFERVDILWTAIRNQARSYGHLNLLRASMFYFGRLDILWDSNRHSSQTLC